MFDFSAYILERLSGNRPRIDASASSAKDHLIHGRPLHGLHHLYLFPFPFPFLASSMDDNTHTQHPVRYYASCGTSRLGRPLRDPASRRAFALTHHRTAVVPPRRTSPRDPLSQLGWFSFPAITHAYVYSIHTYGTLYHLKRPAPFSEGATSRCSHSAR